MIYPDGSKFCLLPYPDGTAGATPAPGTRIQRVAGNFTVLLQLLSGAAG